MIVRSSFFAGLLVCFVALAGVSSWIGRLANESWPYQFVHVDIADTEVGKNPKAKVTLNRIKLCPYILERTIHDAGNNKLHDRRALLSTPTRTGDVPTFTVELKLNGRALPGLATDKVRIGSMCNWVQRLFGPNWGPGWVETRFNFVEAGS